MWKYEKLLQFPVNIRKKDLKMAKYMLTQFGGPNGELGACLRYLTQSYSMPTDNAKALLRDIGTEEIGHVEIICTIINQLIQDTPVSELEAAGLGSNFAIHGYSIFPSDSNGVPFSTAYISSQGDYLANLTENLAAEAKAKATYEQLMQLTNDPDVLGPLAFLRVREIVHFQRFGELLTDLTDLKKRGIIK